jgi:hypothetical protein
MGSGPDEQSGPPKRRGYRLDDSARMIDTLHFQHGIDWRI